ncbi:MAG: Maf family protein [Gemmatimonadales bacterium]
MIVLASSSPRRARLMEMMGIAFEVETAAIEETIGSDEAPVDAARRLAGEKVDAVARRRPDRVVLAADTIVVLDGTILGKPDSEQHAVEMLQQLEGREHLVITAVAVRKGAVRRVVHDETTVRFRSCDDELLRRYVATGEPLDKAGAYGIQGYGAVLVERIEGDYFSVMGLPVRLVIDLLEEVSEPYRFTR